MVRLLLRSVVLVVSLAIGVLVVYRHIGADDELEEDYPTHAARPQGQRKRIRIAQQLEVRLVKAQNGEVVEVFAAVHIPVSETPAAR